MILLVGDPHLKASNIEVAKKFLSWLKGVILEHRPTAVVFLGDVHHTHNVIRSEVVALIDTFLHDIANLCPYVTVIILVGNHDLAHHKVKEIHSWLPYKNVRENLVIVDSPIVKEGILFVPYIDDPVEFQNILNENLHLDHIICHQTFIGANMGFMNAPSGVPVPSCTTRIISGHIHKGQDLGPVWYPGSPFAQEASDNNEVKGIFLYDTSSRSRILIPSPLPQWKTYRSKIMDVVEVIKGMNVNDRNHLILEGPAPELKAFTDSTLFKELRQICPFSVKKEPTIGKRSGVIRGGVNLQQAIAEYVDNIYDGSVPKERLKEKCLNSII